VVSKNDPIVREGLISYVSRPEAARDLDRCGNNPMLVGAVGRGGGRSMCDVIVADGTAREILKEEATSGFLKNYNVIFVVDPPGSALKSGFTDADPEPKQTRVASAHGSI
jgi:hypothetical protein